MDARCSLRQVVETSSAVRATPGRLEKRHAMSQLFATLAPQDLRRATSYLAGEIPQGSLNVGWSVLRAALQGEPAPDDLPLFATRPAPLAPAPLELADVEALFETLKRTAGAGAARRRVALLAALLGRATLAERDFLVALLQGELRQGASRALVIEALSEALALPLPDLRRAIMFAGNFADVADAVAQHGAAALARFGPRPLVAIEPMLASQATSLEAAVIELAPAAVEWKLDGVRVQLHRDGDEVRVYTRQLRDITAAVPELQVLGGQLAAHRCILDGEIIGRGPGGQPLPFQDLMSLLSREGAASRQPLESRFFDVLYSGSESLVDRPYRERRRVLEALLPETHRVPQRAPASLEEAQKMFETALRAGHEGLLVKGLESPYTAGRRGRQWQKVKPALTLDLVILAAEWGHGRRRGFLSNLHLGARDPIEPERFHMLGKTFKGLTDAMLRALTEDLLQIQLSAADGVVHVQPRRVVEIAFDGVQRSPRYDSGFALRFARVKRFRPDKSAHEASRLDEVQEIYRRQTGAVGL